MLRPFLRHGQLAIVAVERQGKILLVICLEGSPRPVFSGALHDSLVNGVPGWGVEVSIHTVHATLIGRPPNPIGITVSSLIDRRVWEVIRVCQKRGPLDQVGIRSDIKILIPAILVSGRLQLGHFRTGYTPVVIILVAQIGETMSTSFVMNDRVARIIGLGGHWTKCHRNLISGHITCSSIACRVHDDNDQHILNCSEYREGFIVSGT